MQKFLYTGPLTALTLPVKEGEPIREVQLIPNKVVELPTDWVFTTRLKALGYLTAVETTVNEPTLPAPKRTSRKQEAE
ncbi:hypothetical protein ACQ4M4_12980 [Leptolyngbya sp. AN02str]|uniref:hypothetical protein n=1 Tax=Leptolyngbya sp. AN02str TaxID=3423363 RepID=UPI003D318CE9